MVNYRHAFHAGNHADVLKHAVLVFWLDSLRRKPTPFAVFDSHAGRGLYDLYSNEAQRSPEWRDGVARIWDWPDPPSLLARYVDAVRAFNSDGLLRTYPGSPALAASALRGADTLISCELHPQEHDALRRALPQSGHVQIHARDGWEALGALLPPPQRRGLVLVDPPYEAPDEFGRATRALASGLKRFSHGGYLWWRPLKDRRAASSADAELRLTGAAEILRVDLWTDAVERADKLVGSSLLLINPPFGVAETLNEALPALSERLSQGAHGWSVAVL